MIGQYIGIYSALVVLILCILIALPYFVFGIKLFWKKTSTKNNVGLLFIKNMSNNYSLPHIIDLRQTDYKYKLNGKEKRYIIQQEHFNGFKVLNLPCAFMSNDNIVTSIGFHSHALDEQGVPMYKDDGQAMVQLEKPSHSLHPELITAILFNLSITEAMQKLFANYRTQILILGGIAIGIGACAYIVYNIQSTDLPAIATQLNSIRAICEGTLANSTVVIQ